MPIFHTKTIIFFPSARLSNLARVTISAPYISSCNFFSPVEKKIKIVYETIAIPSKANTYYVHITDFDSNIVPSLQPSLSVSLSVFSLFRFSRRYTFWIIISGAFGVEPWARTKVGRFKLGTALFPLPLVLLVLVLGSHADVPLRLPRAKRAKGGRRSQEGRPGESSGIIITNEYSVSALVRPLLGVGPCRDSISIGNPLFYLKH